MEDKILDFIHRRFPEDCHWTDGNCYWFARILEMQFNLSIYYDPIPGHFVAVDEDTFTAYDWNGKYIPDNKMIGLWTLEHTDPLWFDHLMRDCKN